MSEFSTVPSAASLALLPCLDSEFGRKMYARGRILAHERDVLPQHLIWDADEVLWSWALAAKLSPLELARLMRHGDVTHREAIQITPGLLEFILGVCDVARERGHDARMRIWTNGYAWRLWAVGQHVPGLFGMLGLAPDARPQDVERSPVVFCRADYVRAIEPLLDHTKRMQWEAQQNWRLRDLMRAHMDLDPFDSNFKIPELARLVGKGGFDDARILIDDQLKNATRFARTGRKAVHVLSYPVRAAGQFSNVAWTLHDDLFEGHVTAIAESIVEGIEALQFAETGKVLKASSRVQPHGYTPVRFELEIPDARIREQWLKPMDDLKSKHLSTLQRWRRRAARLRRGIRPPGS